MDSKLFYSKTFIRDLLIIEALRKTDHESPKTSKQLLDELESMWKKIFPNEPLNNPEKGTATISRHVFDMNQTQLYKIHIHEDNKRGYYNARPFLTTAEAGVIGAAIYSVFSLSNNEKRNLLSKIKNLTDINGESIIYSFERQMKLEERFQRKNPPRILQKIKIIFKAIVEGKKITFRKYQDILKRRDHSPQKYDEILALPYFVFLKDDELYLTAKVGDSQSDFKLKLISHVEMVDENFQSDKEFSLRQHVSRLSQDLIKLRISFPESFIEKVFEHFKYNRIEFVIPTGEIEDGERQFYANIYLNDNEQLYHWLRCHCDKIKIHSPKSVKENLKAQLLHFIEKLNYQKHVNSFSSI